MSRQIGSLHRSISHPANLQTQIPIIPLFAFPPPDSPVISIPSSTISDTNSDISVFHSISQFNNSDVETPDEFADSEPSPSTHTQTNSSVFSKPPDNVQFSEELDNFITLQQQLIYPNTLPIHQLSSTVTSSNPPTPTPLSDYTPSLAQSFKSTKRPTITYRDYRNFKRKFPNHPFTTKPGTAREYIDHLDHTNTKTYLQITLPFISTIYLKYF